MEEATKEQTLFRRSMRSVLLLSAIYAAASNVFLYAAYFYSEIVGMSEIIGVLLMIAFALPVVKLFRNQHWYFPVFIFMFWIPFSVLLAFVLSQVLPLSDNTVDFGLLLVYFLVLNVIITLLGIALGMIVNGCIVLGKRFKRSL